MKKTSIRFACLLLPFYLALSACTATGPSPSVAVSPEAGAPSAQASSEAAGPTRKTVKLSYTDDYLLLEGGTDAYGDPVYGLLDKDGKEVLPAEYHEISISETGLLFVNLVQGDWDIYRILKPDGTQVGPDYSFIECASTVDGTGYYRQASLIDVRPVPPYAAYVGGIDGPREYYLLDENGIPREGEPYNDMSVYDDGSASATRDGILYRFEPDGSVTQQGGEIIPYFDGKYQVKQTYPGTHSTAYALLDRDGRELAPPEYCRIQIPFADRYILYRGHSMVIDGAQALLHDEDGKLLAQNSNGYGFFTVPDGRYIGVSWVGNVFNEGGAFTFEDEAVYDENGNPEAFGYYFVDRDGNRLGERYTYIDFFANEEAQRDGIYYTVHNKNSSSLSTIRDVTVQSPDEAFFLAITAKGETVRIPFADRLIR